ncbi:aminopeptidase P family protein [Desertivirga arenae]|uniref:aminopeptidase P family protein n=1 Tax=Desertivirga arenae TaxID=2810309 RepID=UPI001A967C78|nr:aminopeptidase P family protein [Pedobacter sp. SYSU D00823]
MNFKEKLAAIRSLMSEQDINAYIIPSSDSHISEYVPEYYKILAFASGFTGSAGTLVITREFAGLWADFRYFVQAEEQLKDSGYELVKLKVQHTPEYIQWLYQELPENAKVGFDFSLLSMQIAYQLRTELSYKNISINDCDFISPIWVDRPALPAQKATLLEEIACGLSVAEKLKHVRSAMKASKCNLHFISSLDDIAWLFNIRGNDVNFNPVVLSYAMIGTESCALFIDKEKLSENSISSLHIQGVQVEPYEEVYGQINQLTSDSTVLIDDKRNAYKILTSISTSARIIKETNPSTLLKAIKNRTEIENMQQAMIKDGVALTRFFKWLYETLGKEEITEITASEKVKYFREQNEGFAGVSFASIAGYQAHAALPHYCPTPQTDLALEQRGLFLLDSGGQYYYGTTDITRTVSLGENTLEEKRDYTLVLAALISGSDASFPKGTRGYQIDAICRKPLWENKINYGHGTGHGVGYFLNVHEGPQNIGPANAPFAVEEGMITSIEPGIYRPGKHGVRIENLVLTVADGSSEFGEFLKFETITLCYIDTSLILTDLLDEQQIKWLNDYNEFVYLKLQPYLEPEEAEWLKEKCEKLEA